MDDSSDDDSYDDNGAGVSDMQGISISRLPTSEHPAVAHLEELDFNILPQGFFVISYGARRTGKTHSIEYLC